MNDVISPKGFKPLLDYGKLHVLWKRHNDREMEFMLISGGQSKILSLDVSQEKVRRQLAYLLSRLRNDFLIPMSVPERKYAPRMLEQGESSPESEESEPSTSGLSLSPSIKQSVFSSTATEYPKVLPLTWHKPTKRVRPRSTYREQYKALFGEYPDYTCMKCFKHFSHKHNLTRHDRTVHVPKTKLTCPVCGAIYKHKFHYNDHVLTHENYSFECEKCRTGFHNRNALKAHKRECGKEKLKRPSPPAKKIQKKPIIVADRSKKSTGKLRIPLDFHVTM